MPRISDYDLRRREELVLMYIRRFPDGITASQIAEDMSIERRTVDNYLKSLQQRNEIDKEGKYWFPSFPEPLRLRPLNIEPEEAMALYMAARLLVKQSDRRNESIESALEKLSRVLSNDTGIGDDLYQAACELRLRPLDKDYHNTFDTVMRAYLYRRMLEIEYLPYSGKPVTTLFAPYLLEPSAIGFATYAIGFSATQNGLRTYKLGRIVGARMTRKEYSIPPDFDGFQLLKTGWSIYYGEQTTPVTLRFHPEVARRVEETQWHPSQRLEADGEYLLMHIEVAEFIDLIPWIRAWGASCEVLSPAELRDRMIGEARQLAAMYGVSAGDTNSHRRFQDIFGD